jgi:hypothetical protein
MTTEQAKADGGDPSRRVFERLKAFFDADDWPYDEDGHRLTTGFEGRSGRFSVIAEVRAQATVLVLSIAPIELESTRYVEMTEAVTLANFGLAVGSFDFHLESGTVQFRTSVDARDSEESLTEVLLRHLVYDNVVTIDRYLPALAGVAAGARPVDAIAAVERR